jgi:hypothetical protein
MAFPAFLEHEDSPTESGDRNGAYNYQRVFLTAWADRNNFLLEMFSGGGFGLPCTYPGFPGLYADKFTISRLVNKPIQATITDPTTQLLAHDALAQITITYSPIEFSQEDAEELRDGTYATYTQAESVEYISLVARALKWETSGEMLPADVTAVVPVHTTRHEITWHNVIDPPWDLISAMKGTVNSSAFRIKATDQVAEAESLLFAESSARRTFSLDGLTPWELTLVFIEKSQKSLVASPRGPIGDTGSFGWNHQWDPEASDYDRPVDALGGNPLFALSDFDLLFA